jgi:hypothetical protein
MSASSRRWSSACCASAKAPARSTKALLNVSYFYNRDVKESVEKVQQLIEPMLTVVWAACSAGSCSPCSARSTTSSARSRRDLIAGIASRFASESGKLYQYLDGQRHIGRNDTLPVYILAHPQAISAIRQHCVDSSGLNFEILDNHQAARKLDLKTLPSDSSSELIYLHLLATDPPRQQFAPEDNRHDYHISQIRYGLLGLGAVALLGGGLFAAKEFYESYSLREETQALILSEAELSWRYREISATFPQLGLDNDTLRRVTDSPRSNCSGSSAFPTTPIRLIGKALDQSPAIQLEALDWRLGEAIGPATSGNRNISVLNGGDEIITVRGIVRLEAGATPRQILATLEQFMQFLRVDRNNEVKVIQQPFDIESSQALRGGDKDDENTQPRQFTLQVARRTAP